MQYKFMNTVWSGQQVLRHCYALVSRTCEQLSSNMIAHRELVLSDNEPAMNAVCL